MSCKLIFIRHGQSLGNLKNIFLGHTNLDLSDFGYSQAKCTAEYLNKLHIDSVYSSDLKRAFHTCNEFLKISGHTVITTAQLREIYVGSWEGINFETLKVKFTDSYSVWLNDIGNAAPEGGETVAEFQQRVLNCINEIAKDNDGKTVAVFTHATVIRAFFTYAFGKTLGEMKDLKWATNASISTAEYDSGKFYNLQYGFDEFLKDLKTTVPSNV